MKAYFMKELQALADIPSLTGSEHNVMTYLEENFPRDRKSVLGVTANSMPYFLLSMPVQPVPNHLFVAHMDRVPDRATGKPYVNKIQDKGDRIVGQLDDIIGIVILKHLAEVEHMPFNVLFTTREEHMQSAPQIAAALGILNTLQNNLAAIPIGIDIDIFTPAQIVKKTSITLREEDDVGPMHPKTVKNLRRLATQSGIKWSGNELGSSITEIGKLGADFGILGAHIGLPLLNYHTNREEILWSSVVDAMRLAKLAMTLL